MLRIILFCFFALSTTLVSSQARLELDYTIGQNVGSGSFGFAQIDDKVYFSADDGFHGIELYSYDLATQKTSLIEDFTPGGGSTNPTNLVVSDGTLFFNGSL